MPQDKEEAKIDDKTLIEDGSVETPKEESKVSKEAYLNVSNDMHKYKSELKETKELLSQMQADKEATANEKLAEQGRWEDLYKQSQEKLKNATQGRQEEQDKFINYHKKNSVLSKLGGFKNDEYNNFINVDSVSLKEDGSIDQVSLDMEVNRIKQSYPELLKGASAGKLPNGAPQSGNFGDRTYDELSELEKTAFKRKQFKKPEGY